MKNKTKKILFFIVMFIFVLAFFEIVAFAGETFDPDSYKGSHTVSTGDATYIFDKGGELLKVLRNIAAAISVVTLSVIGIRYMVGSVDQKAEYKQTMFPVVVGCFLIGSLSVILTLIQSIMA